LLLALGAECEDVDSSTTWVLTKLAITLNMGKEYFLGEMLFNDFFLPDKSIFSTWLAKKLRKSFKIVKKNKLQLSCNFFSC
jgi:hypothetical protein